MAKPSEGIAILKDNRTYALPLNVEAIRESPLHLGFGVSNNPVFPTLIISRFQPCTGDSRIAPTGLKTLPVVASNLNYLILLQQQTRDNHSHNCQEYHGIKGISIAAKQIANLSSN